MGVIGRDGGGYSVASAIAEVEVDPSEFYTYFVAASDGATILKDIRFGLRPDITTTALPDGKEGEAYSQALAAAGGAPVTWSMAGGALPDGLTLSSVGVISGTPAKAGTFSFTVRAANAAGDDTKALSINISAYSTPPTEPPPTEPPPTDPPPTDPPPTEPPPTEPPPTPTPSEEAIEGIKKAEDGETVTITLPGGDATLTKEVFEEIAGRDITVEIEIGGVTWIIDGKDVPEDGLKDIDFGVIVGGKEISADVINLVTGEITAVQISLSHEGPFGFEAKLKIHLEIKNAGYYANLYFYNPDTNKLEYRDSVIIGADGDATLTFTGASDYAVFIDVRDHGAGIDKGEDPSAGGTKPKPEPLYKKPFTSAKTDPVEKYVDVLYMGLLGRGPDPGGFNYWTGQLKQGNLTPAQAAWHITFSEELKRLGLADVQFLTRLYNGILGRDPDAGGLENWAALLGRGVSREAVFAAFIASPEFAERCKALGLIV